MKIKPNDTLLFIGDSITSAARDFNQPGEGNDSAFGDGYVRIIRSLLDAVYPDRKIRVINKGIGGHTIRDLAARWEKDVLAPSPAPPPDWLSVMIGINDVWRQFDRPLIPECHVLPDEYESTYRRLLDQTRPLLKGLVIASPYVIDLNTQDAMRARMDQYREISARMAEAYDAVYVDTQSLFDSYLQHYHPNQLCWDRIHPSASGHMLIARGWLNAMGFDWTSS